ncbi:MAG: NAD(P)-dependent oxidoreductase [Anaerolineae bacterium]
MRVLVTGHQGYIGSILVPLLLEEHHEVIGLDNGLFRDCAYTAPDKSTSQIRIIKKDIRDIEDDDLAGVQAIIHLAGVSFNLPDDMRARLLHEINYVAAVKLASLAKFSGVRRFIYLSSYDGTPGIERIEHIEELLGANPLYLERYISRFVELDVSRLADSSFCPIYLRTGDVYGYSPRMRLDLPLNQIVASIALNGGAYVSAVGDRFRPGVHVRDVSSAIATLLRLPQHLVSRKAFGLGDAERDMSTHELESILKDALPPSTLMFVESDDPDSTRAHFHEMELIPGFNTNWSVTEGVEQLYEAYSTVEITRDDINTDRFSRLGHVTRLLADGRIDANLRSLDSGAFRRPTPTPSYMQKSNTSRIG